MDDIYGKITARKAYGPDDEQMQRRQWNGDIYDCTFDIFRRLGDLYVNDERFTKCIDRYQMGLAAFLREAMLYAAIVR